jgi:hypothetical protein
VEKHEVDFIGRTFEFIAADRLFHIACLSTGRSDLLIGCNADPPQTPADLDSKSNKYDSIQDTSPIVYIDKDDAQMDHADSNIITDCSTTCAFDAHKERPS